MTNLRRAAHLATTPDPDLADIPFSALLSPMVIDAWDRLTQRLNQAALAALSPAACAALRHDLAHRLADVSMHACYADFTRSRPAGRTVMLRLDASPATAADEAYRRWCQAQCSDGMQTMLARFPVLGRLLATASLAWQRSTGDLVKRLHEHRDDLERVLGVPRDARVSAIEKGLSDPHRGGHTVAVLTFEGAAPVRVVYKPKDLRLESAFHQLIRAVDDWFGDGLLAGVAVLPGRGDYGFTAWVEHRVCETEELPTFYRAVGRLTCLLYLLGATDAHYENVIAAGRFPVLIDPETLLHTTLTGNDLGISDSVLRTGLLPNWVLAAPDQSAHDPSALGVSFSQRPVRAAGWAHLNTDAMVWTLVQRERTPPSCLPVGPGTANPLPEHIDDLVEGFREVHLACRTEGFRQILLESLARMRGLPRRVVLRATQVYGTTLSNACSAASLASPNARAFHFERLTRASLLAGTREPHWLVYQAELQDLENGNIPYFGHRLGTDVVGGSLGPIRGLVVSDPIEEARLRITNADDEDLRWQQALIRGAVQARGMSADRIEPEPWANARSAAPISNGPQVARGLLYEIAESTVPGIEDPTWLTLSRLPDGRHVRLGLTGDGWYDGRAGIAAVQQWAARGDQAAATATPVIRLLRGDPHLRGRYLRDAGLGFAGAGGFLRWLRLDTGDHTLNAERRALMHEVIAAIPAALVDRDRSRDFMGGSAGLIGPLARTFNTEPTPATEALLVRAAEHLLAGQGRDGGWVGSLGPRPLTGLAHGAAGCGLALIEAGCALQRQDLIDAGAAAFAYERSVYDHAQSNWPDLRQAYASDSGITPTMTAWCHGAPGIGLTRLRALDLVPTHPDAAQWRADLRSAMTTTATAPLPSTDHLCCGLAGRAAILRIAGRATGNAGWMTASRELTDELLCRFDDMGHFRLPADDPRNPATSSPGLMTGVAGIAIHLLTCDYDEDLTAVLL